VAPGASVHGADVASQQAGEKLRFAVLVISQQRQDLLEAPPQTRIRRLLTMGVTEAGVDQLPDIHQQTGVLQLEFLEGFGSSRMGLRQLVENTARGLEPEMTKELVVKLDQVLGQVGGPAVESIVADLWPGLLGEAVEMSQKSTQLAVFRKNLISVALWLS
jgi:hypothetical protein